ncbi:hypothetical protein KR074_012599 [Drosophila pseudoananassae]|nr:hypothetical protein KR074_012599 [Drosophila pseudoananassae]
MEKTKNSAGYKLKETKKTIFAIKDKKGKEIQKRLLALDKNYIDLYKKDMKYFYFYEMPQICNEDPTPPTTTRTTAREKDITENELIRHVLEIRKRYEQTDFAKRRKAAQALLEAKKDVASKKICSQDPTPSTATLTTAEEQDITENELIHHILEIHKRYEETDFAKRRKAAQALLKANKDVASKKICNQGPTPSTTTRTTAREKDITENELTRHVLEIRKRYEETDFAKRRKAAQALLKAHEEADTFMKFMFFIGLFIFAAVYHLCGGPKMYKAFKKSLWQFCLDHLIEDIY